MDTLSNTKGRLKSIISLARKNLEVDFPYVHSQYCLRKIIDVFCNSLDALENISQDDDPETVKAVTRAISSQIFILFPFLGFILRSTDVRNAFEFHGPFLRLIKKTLGEDTKLIISSEWEYSPFTYLPAFEWLSDIVFIGVPASESENALAIPLAGHELGHNIWKKYEFDRIIGPKITELIIKQICECFWERYTEQFEEIRQEKDLRDIFGCQTWQPIYKWCIRQCEELFCDFIGLAIFRKSFLCAFAYLITPGMPGKRNKFYPSIVDRAKYQVKAAERYGVTPPEGYSELFSLEDHETESVLALLMEIGDFTTKELVNDLIDLSFEITEQSNIEQYASAKVDDIALLFGKGVPAIHSGGLVNIVNAGWAFYLNNFDAWRVSYPDIYHDYEESRRMLSDLIYKSIEVLEIETLQESAS